MSHWETILNKSSHTSPVKIVPPKNYSADRVEQYLKAMSTQPVTNQPKEIHQKKTRKLWSIRALFVLLVCFIPVYLWQYQPNTLDSLYTSRLTQSSYTLQQYIYNQPWISSTRQSTREWIDRSRMQIRPYTEKLDVVNSWIENTTIGDLINLFSKYAHQLAYTSDGQLRVLLAIEHIYQTYVLPRWTCIKIWSLDMIDHWHKELNDYVQSGQSAQKKTKLSQSKEEEDAVVDDALRKTAKRILEYIDQKSEESKKIGMKQEEAKRKAQEIIQSITQETENRQPEPMLFSFENAMDRVAFEIQSIMEMAAQQKEVLDKQLDLVQERVKMMDTEQDLSFLVNALKTEVDQLRASAENSVRERTLLAFERLEEMEATNPSVQSHIKRDFQTAQRAALKDLRQAYVKLYQTNQEIDQLAASAKAVS